MTFEHYNARSVLEIIQVQEMTRAGGTSAVAEARGAIPDFGRFRNKSCSNKRLSSITACPYSPHRFSDLLSSLNAERAQAATE